MAPLSWTGLDCGCRHCTVGCSGPQHLSQLCGGTGKVSPPKPVTSEGQGGRGAADKWGHPAFAFWGARQQVLLQAVPLVLP